MQISAIAKPVFHAKRTVHSYCPEIFTLSLELADDILCISKKYYVYGSLHSPVHAVNLKATLQDIYRSFDDPYIIAIDAALGAKEHIGTVTLGDGALFPGIGVSKQLPAVGDIHITGIVNTINCQNRNLILQTTHLSTVVSLATFISKGIRQALLQQDLTCPCDPLVRDTK